MLRTMVAGVVCCVFASSASAQDGFGGARSNGFVREQVRHGLVPSRESFRMEGMLAEHHYPVRAERCPEAMCVFAALGHGVHRPTRRRSAYLLLEPVSGIDPRTFRRGPLNAAIVIDRSGSMSDWKLPSAIAAAHQLVDRLDARDLVSIVVFDHEAHALLAPTAATDRAALHAVLDSIALGGSTNLTAGLELGFRSVEGVADARARRLFVFTDEMPNVGPTDPGSFAELVGSHASRGTSVTLIGVGLDLDAELAHVMAQFSGGAYEYLEEGGTSTFGEDFDQRVSPVARDVSITVDPGPGLRVASVYGVPNDAFALGANGTVTLRASTVFLDRRRSGAVVRLEAIGDEAAVLHPRAIVRYSFVRTNTGARTNGQAQVSHDAVRGDSLAEFTDPHHYRAYALVSYGELLREGLDRWWSGDRRRGLDLVVQARASLDFDAALIGDPQLETERVLADGVVRAMRAESTM
jgi:Ca-activated chloride channel family protein